MTTAIAKPTNHMFKDLEGKKFGRLTVLSYAGACLGKNNRGKAMWECRCECGAAIEAVGTNLSRGNSRSCGCLSRDTVRERSTRHGHATRGKATPEYRAWCGIVERCCNTDNKMYVDYGGRGITVCRRWRDSLAFLEDMGPRPSPKHSIDRIDNDGDYEPSNVRWATQEEQANNKRNSHWLTVNGETVTVAEWARTIGINPKAIHSRLKRGWPAEEAVNTPVEKP